MNKKKIYIGTLHYGFNEGALAQAYCLSKIIEQEIPCSKAEIIDRRYPKKVAVYGNPLNQLLTFLVLPRFVRFALAM